MKKCDICGIRYAECTHHLIFGSSRRKLADADGLTLDLCNECHNMSVRVADRIHDNPIAEALSKMLGQALYERNYYRGDRAEEEARKVFIKRYGRNYL